MAEKSPRAAAAMESLYGSKSDATLEEFLAVAVQADPALEGVAKRSFNARYLLPLKRAHAPKKPRRRTKKKVAAIKAANRKAANDTVASKSAAKPATRRPRKASRPRIAADSRNAARQLVLDRDQRLLAALRANGNPQVAYELAAGIDDFVEKLASTLRG